MESPFGTFPAAVRSPTKTFISVKVSDQLGILWPEPGGGKSDVPGITFYGFFPDAIPHKTAAITVIWARQGHDTRVYEWGWTDWPVLALDVKFVGPPNGDLWASSVQATLIELARLGAVMAWCGGELCLSMPLAATQDPGNVYAAYSAAAGFLCNGDLCDEWRGLTESQGEALTRLLIEQFPDRCERSRQADEKWERENRLEGFSDR